MLCERWTVTRCIQSGTYGRGWVAHDNVTHLDVFLKTFRATRDGGPGNDGVRKEVQYLHHASMDGLQVPPHPCVVGQTQLCYGPVVVPTTGMGGELFFLVTPELCSGGELFDHVLNGKQEQASRSFDEDTARTLFRDVISG